MDIKGKVHKIRDDLGPPFEPRGNMFATDNSDERDIFDLPCISESFDAELVELETLLKRHAEFDSWDEESSP